MSALPPVEIAEAVRYHAGRGMSRAMLRRVYGLSAGQLAAVLARGSATAGDSAATEAGIVQAPAERPDPQGDDGAAAVDDSATADAEVVRAAQGGQPRSNDPWPEEKVAELRRLWATKMTVAEIAARFGVTPPTISKKARRYGLEPRNARRKAEPAEESPTVESGADYSDPMPEVSPADRASAPRRLPHDRRAVPIAPFSELGPPPRTCQWIAGDPKTDPTKCGAPVTRRRDGSPSPYCATHHARCYERPVPLNRWGIPS
jgi:hypothetical protein